MGDVTTETEEAVEDAAETAKWVVDVAEGAVDAVETTEGVSSSTMSDHNQDLHQTLGDLLEIKSKLTNISSRNLLWKKVMEAQAKKTWLGSWKQKMKTRSRKPSRNKTLRMIKRRRTQHREGSRRSTMIEKKVRTLKKLIPNGDSTVGLDGLFRETAEYISHLQMRVSLMQAVVNALSNSE
ncbi:hypothetical protein R6Q57_017370 [Mikania cordata]